jgi:peroxiredoxin/mono/diheme cytochrome c family protein
MLVRLLAATALGATLALSTACSPGQFDAAEATEQAKTPTRVDNFRLVDHTGRAHELYRMQDAKAVVLVMQGNGCPIVRNLSTDLKALHAEFDAKGVEFFMINSNLQDTREAIAKEVAEYGFPMPVLKDSEQLVGESLGVERTAEVLVLDPAQGFKVVYHGPVNDRLTYERQRNEANNNYVADALNAVIGGKPVKVASAQASGCLINFPEREKADQFRNISYSTEVAPIIEQKCVTCHQEGGIGPMRLDSYEMVKGFAPMIREVIRTDRMPPWHADPEIGTFRADKSLSSEQIKTLVHWVEAGAPRGEGVDPLAAVDRRAPEWPLGEPDLIIDIPTYPIPASGVVDYQRPYVNWPVNEERWLKASTTQAGVRQGVHHILTGHMKEVPADGIARETSWGVSIGGYAVGSESIVSDPDHGSLIPAGGAIGFQMHYTPFGKESVDASRIGLYFYPKGEKPKYVMREIALADNSIVIPPNQEFHREIAYIEFPQDALLYSAFPHAHYRGEAAEVKLRRPDGSEEVLVSLPKYDFNWQRHYEFVEPVAIPAGSKIITTYHYNNSIRNPANPDPNKTVVWGDQSFEEMLFTNLRYRWVAETSDNMIGDAFDEALNSGRLMGMLDDNINGKVERSELRGSMAMVLGPRFAEGDANGDGGIDAAEMKEVMKALGNMRRRGGDGSSGAPASGSSTSDLLNRDASAG